MKKCKTCELTKPLTEFSPAAKYKDKQYYRRECKECNRLEQQSDQTSQIKYRNSERGKAVKSAYKKLPEYREQQRIYEATRLETDTLFLLRKRVRDRVRICLKRKHFKKKNHLNEYLGCTIEELRNHLEIRFTEGMSWDNYGKWHIDHIIPLSSSTSEEEIYKLCHYLNLQPLWAIDNLKKSDKYQKLVRFLTTNGICQIS